jgi:zinc protease
MTAETVAALDLEKSLAFYKECFADAGDFTFVFTGSLDEAALKPLVERYLASLPSTGRTESWKDVGIRYKPGIAETTVEKGVEPQSRTALVFTGPFEYTQEERVAIRALADVVQTRMHETLREALGGTYSANAGASYSQIPVPEYSLSISFTSDPARTDVIVAAAMQQIESLKATGPTEKEASDAREKLLRDAEANAEQNGYWLTQLSLRYQSGEPLDSLFSLADYYRKISPAIIQDAAKRYLNPANHVRVTLMPEKK